MTGIHIKGPVDDYQPYKCGNRRCPTEYVHFNVLDEESPRVCPDCKGDVGLVNKIHLVIPTKELSWVICCEAGMRNLVERWHPNRHDAGPDYPFFQTTEWQHATCYDCLRAFEKTLEDHEEDLIKFRKRIEGV